MRSPITEKANEKNMWRNQLESQVCEIRCGKHAIVEAKNP